jgi:hypothetical protein
MDLTIRMLEKFGGNIPMDWYNRKFKRVGVVASKDISTSIFIEAARQLRSLAE